ncbi:MAG: hypothetical protein ABI281_03975 [Caldimonas sp.]
MAARPPTSKRATPRWMSFALDRLGSKKPPAEAPPPSGIVERQRVPASDRPPSLAQLCAELQARLLAHEEDAVALVMGNLVLVHDALGHKGWAGVESLPRRVLAMALLEAEMMAGHEPSPLLNVVIERLRASRFAAEVRAERAADRRDWAVTDIPEVSEGTHEEYDRMERSWIGTVPADLMLPASGFARP